MASQGAIHKPEEDARRSTPSRPFRLAALLPASRTRSASLELRDRLKTAYSRSMVCGALVMRRHLAGRVHELMVCEAARKSHARMERSIRVARLMNA